MTIEDYAFFCCIELSEIIIPASVTKIGESAFAACALTEINVPEGVEIIGNMAFAQCDCLERLCLPSTVNKIGFGVIEISDQLKEINYSGTREQWEKIDIDGFNEKLYQLDIECIDGIIKS